MSDETVNTVLIRGEPHFTMTGQRVPDSLHDTDQKISVGLVARLRRYAEQRLSDSGFTSSELPCKVYTMDGNLAPVDRYYTVEFTNAKGARIGVQGILTERGWPQLDHGLTITGTRS